MNYKFSLILALATGLVFSCKTPSQITQTPNTEDLASSPAQKPMGEEERVATLEQAIEQYKPSPERDFDLLHSDLDIALDLKAQTVLGTAILSLKPYFYPQNTLILDAQDFDVHSVRLLRTDSLELNFRYDSQKLEIYLPQTFTKEDTLRVMIKYTAHPSRNAGNGSAAITDTQGLYFIPSAGDGAEVRQVWTQGETDHNSKWFPTIDAPNERATHALKLRVPDQWTTISNGELVSQTRNADGTRSDYWRMDLPHAPYLVAFAAGDFERIEDQWEGIPLGYYVEPDYAEGAKKVFGNTPRMLAYFSELLGVKYPWSKYDQVVVRDFVSGAMENTTVSIFMEDLNMTAKEAIDSEFDGIIAHELFHHWFGDYVTTESWSNLPLNEAFANYSEYLWYSFDEGRDAADLHHIGEMESYFYEAEEKQVDLIRFDYEHNEDMFDNHSYAKGGRVLHMLRNYLGDEAFFEGLNFYLTQHALESVEIHDLRLAMEEVSGKDLNWFFDQWFLSSGHPELVVRMDYSEPGNVLVTVSQEQDLESSPLYIIPFELSWYSGGERYSRKFTLDRKVKQFALENKDSVTAVYFDEAKVLLAKKRGSYGQDYYKQQFMESQFGVSRYEALDSLAQYGLSRGIMERSLGDEFWAIRERSLQHFGGAIADAGLEAKVEELAATDPNNGVRATAIDWLVAYGQEDYSSQYMIWVEDSSYYVAGAALEGLLTSSGTGIPKALTAASFEEEGNIRMIVPLADYYTRERVPGKGGWLHEKISETEGQSLYYLIGYYADYFVVMPEEGTMEAVNNLVDLATEATQPYIRLAAFQSLFGFVDEEGVLDKLKKIYGQEADESIKSGEEYFIFPYLDEN